MSARDVTGNLSEKSDPVSVSTQNVTGEPNALACHTSTAAWQSFATSAQEGAFSAHFSVTPDAQTVNAVVGFGNVGAQRYDDLAAIVLFHNGTIRARNGGRYEATHAQRFSTGTTYEVAIDIRPQTGRYDVRVNDQL